MKFRGKNDAGNVHFETGRKVWALGGTQIMDKRKHWVIRLFLALFTVSVSVAIIPCGIINAYGLFGEIKAVSVTEDKDQIVANVKAYCYKETQKIKGINIFNIWFELLVSIICICFTAYMIKLPREDTIVTLKVRMDN